MRREMARRPLVEWPDGRHYPELDVTASERAKHVAAVLFLIVVLIAIALLSGGPQ